MSRRLALAAVLLLAPAFAGCSLKDWWNYDGTVRIELAPMGPLNTTLTDFRSLKVAIYGVSIKQVLVLEPKEFSFQDRPLVVDFVEKGARREKVPLAETVLKIRAVESVTLHLDVIEAIDATGKSLPVCREGDASAIFPCFFVPENGAFRHQDVPFAPERGGSVTFDYPLGVRSVSAGGAQEYFLFEDPALAAIHKAR